MAQTITEIYRLLKPFIQRQINEAVGGGEGRRSAPAAGTMGGDEWEYAGNMRIDANSAVDTVISIINQGTGTASLDVEGNIVLGGTVDGVDVSEFVLTVALNADVDMEAMRVAFNAISWAQFAIWETFDDATRRDVGEPGNAATITASTLITGSSTPGYAAKWKSVYYTDATEVYAGTSTGVGSGYLEDSGAGWFDDQYQGFVLIDSAAAQFAIITSTASPRRLTVSGTPAAGAYTVTAGDPAYAVVFAAYECADTGGYGDVKIEVTFDGGSHWLTVLDTSGATNMIGGIIEMAWPGDSYAFRVTVTNDGSGNSPVVYRVLVCTDPSVWQ